MAFSKVGTLNFEKIADFNFFYLKMKSNKEHLSEQSILMIFITLLIRFMYEFIRDLKHGAFTFSINRKHLFFSTTPNQLKALISLYEIYATPKCFYHTDRDSTRSISKIPQSIPTLISLFLFPIFLTHYFIATPTQKKNIRLSRNDVALSYGFYYFILLHFRFLKPTCIILSNDHMFQHRIWMRLSARFGVPSIYLQHAPVTSFFPPLEFDLSLLEGEVSKQKYFKAGPHKQVELIGMMKFDSYYSRIKTRSIRKMMIGVSINLMDDFDLTKQVILSINSNFNEYQVKIRPHPSIFTKRYTHVLKQFKALLVEFPYVMLSHPDFESSFEFISQVDVNIAGRSGIHLDSVLLNVPSIYFAPDKKLDNQSFVENGIVSKAFTIEELSNELHLAVSENKDIRNLSKIYVDTVNTKADGKSTLLANNLLENFLDGYYKNSVKS